MVFKKTPVREQLVTGGGVGGVQMEIVQASYVIFSLSGGTRDRGGGVNRIFSGREFTSSNTQS